MSDFREQRPRPGVERMGRARDPSSKRPPVDFLDGDLRGKANAHRGWHSSPAPAGTSAPYQSRQCGRASPRPLHRERPPPAIGALVAPAAVMSEPMSTLRAVTMPLNGARTLVYPSISTSRCMFAVAAPLVRYRDIVRRLLLVEFLPSHRAVRRPVPSSGPGPCARAPATRVPGPAGGARCSTFWVSSGASSSARTSPACTMLPMSTFQRFTYPATRA